MPKKTVASLKKKKQEREPPEHRAVRRALKQAHAAADDELYKPDEESGTGERIKTSLFINHSILAAAKQRARTMGLSFNAWATLAFFNMLQPGTQVGTYALRPEHLPPARPKAKPSKLGDGFTLPGEGDEPEAFCRWEDVARYAKAQRENPEGNFWELGKQLGLTMDEARAADIAQGTDEFERYMEGRNG